VGKTADGSPLSRATYIAADNSATLYTSLYQGLGFIAGPLSFDPSGNADVSGLADWTRPARTAATRYSNGFQTRLTLLGSQYVAPHAPAAALSAGSHPAELGKGDLGATTINKTVTLGANEVFAVAPSGLDALKLSVRVTDGHLGGSFFDPISQTTLTLQGVILQKTGTAAGYFLAPTSSGYIEIGAAP
jgi:hypothetical protein